MDITVTVMSLPSLVLPNLYLALSDSQSHYCDFIKYGCIMYRIMISTAEAYIIFDFFLQTWIPNTKLETHICARPQKHKSFYPDQCICQIAFMLFESKYICKLLAFCIGVQYLFAEKMLRRVSFTTQLDKQNCLCLPNTLINQWYGHACDQEHKQYQRFFLLCIKLYAC